MVAKCSVVNPNRIENLNHMGTMSNTRHEGWTDKITRKDDERGICILSSELIAYLIQLRGESGHSANRLIFVGRICR